MKMIIGGFMIVFGGIYLWKPTLFRRGIWMKTSVMISCSVRTKLHSLYAGAGCRCHLWRDCLFDRGNSARVADQTGRLISRVCRYATIHR